MFGLPPRSTLFPYTTLFRSDRFVIVSIFIPKLRLILILNSFLGSSDSLSRNFRSEERFSRNAETDLVCRLLLEKKNRKFEQPLLSASAVGLSYECFSSFAAT